MNISIITPCLNAANALPATVDSVLAQGYPNLEYLIIDGGSQDGTRQVLERYKTRVAKIISEPDKGAYDAFNKGVRLATGDVVGILNAGDRYEPGVLNKVAAIFDNHPDVDLVHGDQRSYDSHGQYIMTVKPLLAANAWRHDMPFNHPTCFVRRHLYDRIGLFDTAYRIAADYDFVIRAIKAGARTYYMPEVLAHFYHGGLSSKLASKLREERRLMIAHQMNPIMASTLFTFKWLKGSLRETLDHLGFHPVLRAYRALSKRKVVA